jgi:CHASE3 domain sensor protein
MLKFLAKQRNIMLEEKFIGLLFVVMALFILMAVFFYQLMRQSQQINESLKDIAKSQRILSNNPKDFEETKKANAMKNKSPYD